MIIIIVIGNNNMRWEGMVNTEIMVFWDVILYSLVNGDCSSGTPASQPRRL
jgi:hypothetical protein